MPALEFVIAVVVALALIVALIVGAIAAVAVATRRRIEVSPRHRTGAPVRWAVTPTRPAMLHRRLRAAVLLARSAVPPRSRREEPSTIETMVEELELLASSVDRDLIAAGRTPMDARTPALRKCATRVGHIERIASRLAAAGHDQIDDAEWRTRAEHLDRSADALAAARAELAQLERAVARG